MQTEWEKILCSVNAIELREITQCLHDIDIPGLPVCRYHVDLSWWRLRELESMKNNDFNYLFKILRALSAQHYGASGAQSSELPHFTFCHVWLKTFVEKGHSTFYRKSSVFVGYSGKAGDTQHGPREDWGTRPLSGSYAVSLVCFVSTRRSRGTWTLCSHCAVHDTLSLARFFTKIIVKFWRFI
jgi:hypothetical protein